MLIYLYRYWQAIRVIVHDDKALWALVCGDKVLRSLQWGLWEVECCTKHK